MKKLLFTLFLLINAAALFADGEHDDDEILLQLRPNVTIATINARYNTTTSEVLLGGTVYEVQVQNSADLDTVVAAMQEDPDIVKVEFNFVGESPEGVRQTLAVVDTTPTPSEYNDQDAFNRIKGPQAQTVSTGQGVVVAIIDTGVDYNHPDLAGHILKDAGNNVIGYDFVDKDNDPMDQTNALDDDNDQQTDEGAGHGTHVAGIIALIAPDAKIMPLRALDSEGRGSASFVAAAIDFAVEYSKDNRIPVIINLSLGLSDRSLFILDALLEAEEHDVPVIASAGNANSSAQHYPAADQKVIGVAATDAADLKAGFSNYGKGWIDLSSPGVGIYSTFLNNGYAIWDGTSMSAPFVSGEAALVASTLLALDPGEDPTLAQILFPLTSGVDDIYAINPAYKKGKRLGAGRIDIYSAVQIANGSDVLSIKKAVYKTNSGKLTVKMKSTAASQAVLTVEGYGVMTFNAVSKIFTLNLPVSPAPTKLTIISSKGGIVDVYPIIK